ncbi:DUF4365 domain-containing protein [Oceanobacillus picturae]|uniref:DUF4365 domain-containing protein n=1 Tax=Oceanobacillus picturae TaxID=171693 RepID=UPI000E6935D1|nr:DUF4365 domain-containing protein [Oceanobacillus picturae]RIU92055.1 DUF4365 domain-containing protein [Oceanobacillus picturae]
MNLPKRSEAVRTGNVAVDVLASTLNNFANVISVPVENDLGIDLICELMESNIPTGSTFNIQCKGTKDAKENKDFFSIPIKVSTINYWLINKAPTLLILVDIKNHVFYWTYPYYQINERLKEIQRNKTVNIKISREDCFSFGEAIPEQMGKIVKEFDYTIINMKFKELKHGVSLQVGDIYKLYREFKEQKFKEKFRLSNIEKEFLQYVLNIREQFSHFFVTSDIRIWRDFNNQLCFFLFKKTDNGNCYYIADVIIYFKHDGSLEYIIELTNRAWLNVEGDIYENIEAIVRHLNEIY